eukprot:TRINITY_DN11877_c0_g1_i1.p1 TRINITY_DN11877_c0_g1~~TRINITY_DN11877_c0_g1_i1.p1  ORF type:complete len:608 (+),score=154.28 TRINITY_DN11877_c0_g1_i1:69-1892(+)
MTAPVNTAAATTGNRPHTISIMNALNYQVHTMPCDLATLTAGEVYMFCQNQFGMVPESFEIIHGSVALMNDFQVKAIDVGLSNGMYVVMQPKGTYNPALDMNVGFPSAMSAAGGSPPLMPSPTMLPSPQMLPSSNIMPSPPMMPSAAGMVPSPQMQPMSPLADSSLDLQYDMALAQNVATQMHLMNALQMGGSPARSPSPVSPPMFPQNMQPQRSMRPTGVINLNAMGDLSAYAMTNEGSRALVAAIEEASDEAAISLKLGDLAGKFATVACHQHGSKVVRALLKASTPAQVSTLIQMGCQNMIEICDSNTGSDILVEAIAASDNEEDGAVIVNEIVRWGPKVCTLINGRKIIQAVLAKFTASSVEPIFDMIGCNLLQLATDQTGCVTIQRCLDHASNLKLKTQLQLQIMEATRYLIEDMYGNYVLQHAIKGDVVYSQILASKFIGNVANYASNKYSSCVIEKCLTIGPDETREIICMEIIPNIKKLMWDGFGNFVVQSAVDTAPQSVVDLLKDAIQPHIADCPYGYRIEGKLNKRVKKSKRSSATRPSSERTLSPEEQLVHMMLSQRQNVVVSSSPQASVTIQMSRVKGPEVTPEAAALTTAAKAP